MGKKKIILVSFFILLLVAAGICFWVIAAQKKKNTDSTLGTTIQFTNISVVNPSGWHSLEQPYNNGQALVLKPDSSNANNPLPSFTIITYPLSSLSTRQEALNKLKGLGYETTSISVLGQDATMESGPYVYTGSIPLKIPKFYDHTLLVTKGDSVYEINYKYAGDKKNPEMEQFFQNILSSVKLH